MRDVDDQSIQFDDHPFPQDMLPGDKGKSLRAFLDGVRIGKRSFGINLYLGWFI